MSNSLEKKMKEIADRLDNDQKEMIMKYLQSIENSKEKKKRQDKQSRKKRENKKSKQRAQMRKKSRKKLRDAFKYPLLIVFDIDETVIQFLNKNAYKHFENMDVELKRDLYNNIRYKDIPEKNNVFSLDQD